MASSKMCYCCNKKKSEFYNDSILCVDCFEVYPFCLECGINERNRPHPWCEECYQLHHLGGPHGVSVKAVEPEPDPVVLQRIQKNSYAHEEVVKLFTDRWDRRKSQCPEIVMAYSITNNKLKSRYDDYKKQLKADGKNPNEGIYFHGTVLSCDILNNGVECDNSRCSICGIAKEGFNEEKIGYNIPRFQRFGSGIYLAPNSSKCHDYTQGWCSVRAMLVCKVALGNYYTLTQNQLNLTTAPSGYDSVYGKNSLQGVLNYDEVVVYWSKAILPTHIIVYDRDGVSKIAK